MSDDTPQVSDREDPRLATATSGVFAAAADLVASSEAVVRQEHDDAADIDAAAAWASAPSETASVFEADRVAWLEAAHAGGSTTGHDPLPRQSVMAATVAAEALECALRHEELVTSDEMTEGIAAIVAATTAPAARHDGTMEPDAERSTPSPTAG